MNLHLTAVLSQLHAAIVGTPAPTSTPPRPDPAATGRTVAPVAAVRVNPPAAPLPAPSRPSCAPLDAVADLSALARGPRRLLQLLHDIAVATVAARAYPVTPSQVTIHQPQELLAAALGCHVVTVWRWTQPLRDAGLIAARAHFTTSKGSTRADGTLYAVTLQAGHRAHLSHDDLAHQWRDLDGDREAGRTAWSALQVSGQRTQDEWLRLLRNWAVVPGSVTDNPLVSDHCGHPSSVLDVVYMLPLLLEAHPTKRPALVGIMASALAHALHDPQSRRWYCRTIWSAWKDELEGRAGLQVLAAQLARLEADQTEWTGLRSPGALLAFRLRGA